MLFFMFSLLSSPSFAEPPADPAAQMMAQVQHASPMPPYMGIIKKHEAELNLTDAQQKEIGTWQGQHKGPFLALVNEIITKEGEISEMSRSGVSAKAMLKKLKETHKVRTEAAEMKAECRDNLMTILSEAQWAQVVSWSKM